MHRMTSGARWPVALVTGASSGIGEEFARLLAAEGSDLVVVARRRDRLEALAAELTARHGTQVEVLVADLLDDGQRAAVERRLTDPERPVDLLVNNAGFGSHGRFVELPLDREEGQIRLNVLALVRLTRVALPGMVERRQGAVLNVSSLASLQPLPYSATYSATKAFVTSFSGAVHEEVRGTGVTVLALMPGFVDTEFQGSAGWERKSIPGPAWMSARSVAEAGLRALAQGRAGYVPGLGYQLLGLVSRLTPWSVSRRVTAFFSRRL